MTAHFPSRPVPGAPEVAAGPLLRRLSIRQFRNYADLLWEPAGRLVVISGANGTGKTNLLEAVSLLTPGRGLRAARTETLARTPDPTQGPAPPGTAWAVAGRFSAGGGSFDIATGAPTEGVSARRILWLDGAKPPSQTELAARLAVLWLTPQMDRLFSGSPGGRRRFFDRLVWTLEPAHARAIAGAEAATARRNRLLAEGGADPGWLGGLEAELARHAVAATAARQTVLQRLAAATPANSPFPAARVTLRCPIAERLRSAPALAVEDWLRESLASARREDARAGATGLGAHRADMTLADAETGRGAELSSTGQQKALLLGLILAHAALVTAERGAPPLLLLDEPAVHLDRSHRDALFAALRGYPGQALLTGVEREAFAPLAGAASALRIAAGALAPDPAFPGPEPRWRL